jgi:hypothetical protein
MIMRMRGMALAVTAPVMMMMAGELPASAQTDAPRPDMLRQQIERRYEVLPLRNGLALRPKSPVRGARGVRSIELTDGTIAIDGTPATGAELRATLGADADLVLRLSYLEPDARRALFALDAPPTPPTSPTPGTPPEAPRPPPSPRRSRHSDDRMRIGGSITVDADESVNDVVVIGGSAHIHGEVTGDVVVIGGLVDLGPHADVRNDVTVVGGTLRRDPNAHVGGRVNEVGPGLNLRGLRVGRLPFGPGMLFWGTMWGGLFAFVSTLIRLAILCILASLVLLVGHDYVERISARAAAEPVKAALVGVLAQLLFLPLLIVTVVVLIVTIIGIPFLALVPFVVLGLVVLLIVGFTAVAYQVGRLVSARLGSATLNPYLTVIVGILAVLTPVLLGRILGIGGPLLLPLALPVLFIGFLTEYLAWTVGFGAVALNRFDKRASSSVAGG